MTPGAELRTDKIPNVVRTVLACHAITRMFADRVLVENVWLVMDVKPVYRSVRFGVFRGTKRKYDQKYYGTKLATAIKRYNAQAVGQQ